MKEKDSEISFLDLFLVFVKYRKIIFIPTLVFLLFWGLFIFAKTYIFHIEEKKSVQVISSLKIEQLSPSLANYLDINVSSTVKSSLEDYMNFSNIEKKYHIWTSQEMSERVYNAIIKNILESKSFLVDKKSNDVIRVTSTIQEEDIELYNYFISDYIQYISQAIEYKIQDLLNSAEKNIDIMIERFEKNDSFSPNLSSLLSLKVEILNFKECHHNFIEVDGKPFVISVGNGNSIKIISSIIAIFIFSVIFAFLLNLINEIKNDSVKYQKIKDAWKAGK